MISSLQVPSLSLMMLQYVGGGGGAAGPGRPRVPPTAPGPSLRSPGRPGGGTPRLAQPGNNHESYDRMVRVNLNTLSVAVFGRVQITIYLYLIS